MEADENREPQYLRAIRLINTDEERCSFEVGKLPIKAHIAATYFFGKTEISNEHKPHPAPCTQFVVTLKGKLRFMVSNGDTFIVEPGVILLAEDTKGPGHSWELLEGDTWERLYIPYPPGTDHGFVSDKVSAASKK
ncbi:hypothetical protein J0X19_12815 [Hymenobacter sp. BT186]|uniref:Cupin domain-containing protein n=1 Tax=Hymenobacter telluris TaxID=2816474 RepID=A0A939EX99_9BACT|nr:hypothetical protein [Hymenobacter telluris]MBO0358831.1 hypothetical protein [Hymenobacter telluris]MBW3374857.1 hypothetical protein [Hymenobacter norwichensis]